MLLTPKKRLSRPDLQGPPTDPKGCETIWLGIAPDCFEAPRSSRSSPSWPDSPRSTPGFRGASAAATPKCSAPSAPSATPLRRSRAGPSTWCPGATEPEPWWPWKRSLAGWHRWSRWRRLWHGSSGRGDAAEQRRPLDRAEQRIAEAAVVKADRGARSRALVGLGATTLLLAALACGGE